MKVFTQSLAGLALACCTLSNTAVAGQQQATVILSQSCDYVLLNSSKGMVLVKQLDGAAPQPGDTLSGDLEPRSFSKLMNTRNQDSMQVWVDLVDPHSNKALGQYGRYCT